MIVLKGILKESLEYYEQLEKELKGRLRLLPVGSVKKRRLNRQIYYYLQSRKGRKVVHKYLGKQKPVELQKKLKERKQFEKELKKVYGSLRLLSRIKKGKSKK